MFPFIFLPSSLLTVDIEVEEVAAPMEDGALVLPRLHVDPMFERPAPRLDLSLDGLPATLLPFPGRTRYAWTWFPYGLYDVADIPLPYYNGDLTGLVSGASEYVYTAWYNDVTLAGDK